MADQREEIMGLVRNIVEEDNLRVTLKHSVRNGFAAGVGGFVGCVLAGPWGGIPGAAAGAAFAAATGENFKPLWRVIAEWPPEVRQRLAHRVGNIMQQANVTNVAALAAVIAGGNAVLRQQVVAAIVDFAQNEMHEQFA